MHKLVIDMARDMRIEMYLLFFWSIWRVDKAYTITKQIPIMTIVKKNVMAFRQNFWQEDKPRLPQFMSSG